ncbi:Hydroxyacylglutathione hydrolase GloB [Alphaproteobacteria bacterium SO-S41]|nr:Hydroxyacylglutathione hydrolase GloB [Alphaproteobacteria bacterium SO-S41]
MLSIDLVPCLSDNYAYLLHDPVSGAVGIVDPSEAPPVLAALAARGWKLTHIFNTHHHFDHTGGNIPLKEATGAVVIGPKADAHRIPGLDTGVGEGDTVTFGTETGGVFDIPAHTTGHIALYFAASKAVFTGDTLFAMGCGRLFEGTPADMFAAMRKLEALPGDTRVYCGHEYTESNGRFALHVEPDNADIQAEMVKVRALRAAHEPTIPSTIALERRTNPFMRAANAGELGARRAAKDSFK